MQFRLLTLLLAALIVPPVVGLIVLATLRTYEPSKRDAAKGYLLMLGDAALLYRQEFGEYPPDLKSLHSDIGHDAEPILIQPLLLDPWGRAYCYEQPVSSDADFRIWSFGADGIDGTADDIEVREAEASR